MSSVCDNSWKPKMSVSVTASNPGAHSIVQLDRNFETDGNSELSSDLTVDSNSDPELDQVGEMEEEEMEKEKEIAKKEVGAVIPL